MTTITPELLVEELWTFAGLRVLRGGKRGHAWLAPGKTDLADEYLFAPTKGPAPALGAVYAVKVTRPDDERVTRHGAPVYTGRERVIDRAAFERIDAANRAAELELRRAALERSEKRASALDDALAPALAYIKAAGPLDRDAVLSIMTRKLARAW